MNKLRKEGWPTNIPLPEENDVTRLAIVLPMESRKTAEVLAKLEGGENANVCRSAGSEAYVAPAGIATRSGDQGAGRSNYRSLHGLRDSYRLAD